MKHATFRRIILGGLTWGVILLATGCTSDYITKAARDSAANFVIDVFSTAVDAVARPD